MAGEPWAEWPFEEVIDFQEGPGILARDFCEHGVPLVRLSGLERGRSVLEGCNYLDPVTVRERWAHFALQQGDILLSTSASLGRIAVVSADAVGAIPYTGIIRMRPRDERLYGPFIRYLLEGPEFQQQAEVVGVGSVIRHFGPMHLRQMSVRLPSPREQRAIAHVLGTLDDRIELHRRMNDTLEAIARGLFKSWFVDFDPVRAKAEGRDPGLPKHLADLFPDGFEESELGEIPRGWRVATVHELAEINARTLSAADSLDVIDYIEISEVMRGEIGSVPRYLRGTEPSRARRRLRHGDSVVSTVRPDRGAHFLCLNPPETLIASTGFAVLSPRDGSWALLHCALTRPDVGEEFGRLADGGAYPAIRPEAIASLTLAMPPGADLPSSFQKLAAPLFDRTHQNRSEAKTLTALRDTLLPRLISGDLRVQDAERFIAEHAL